MVKRLLLLFMLFSSPSMAANFSHIDTFDQAGRWIGGWSDSNKAAYLPYFCSKVDITEDLKESGPYLKTYCPNIKGYRYTLDHTQMQNGTNGDPMNANGAWGEGPEEVYLHLSNNSTLNYGDGRSVNVTGCPGTAVKSCRMQVWMWSDDRWVYNVANPNFRVWQADRIINTLGTRFDGIWLDEHLAGFRDALYMWHNWGGANTTCTGGCVIKEYGLNINAANLSGKDYNQLDLNYNNDMVGWFTYLKGRLTAVGKFSMANPATGWGHELNAPISAAIGGIDYEHVVSASTWWDYNHFQSFVNLVKTLRGYSGNKQDLQGTPADYDGPDGYTAGNYDTAQHRYDMSRYAIYLLVRGAPGSPGTSR